MAWHGTRCHLMELGHLFMKHPRVGDQGRISVNGSALDNCVSQGQSRKDKNKEKMLSILSIYVYLQRSQTIFLNILFKTNIWRNIKNLLKIASSSATLFMDTRLHMPLFKKDSYQIEPTHLVQASAYTAGMTSNVHNR